MLETRLMLALGTEILRHWRRWLVSVQSVFELHANSHQPIRHSYRCANCAVNSPFSLRSSLRKGSKRLDKFREIFHRRHNVRIELFNFYNNSGLAKLKSKYSKYLDRLFLNPLSSMYQVDFKSKRNTLRRLLRR